MTRRSLMTLASLTLAATLLAGCGSTGMVGLSASGNGSANAQSVDTQRKVPPSVELSGNAAIDATVSPDFQSDVDQARRIASDALYRYDDLLRDWKRAYSDYEKDRIEERMLNVLLDGVKDAQRAASKGYGSQARHIYDIADRALDRYESLRRDWKRAYSKREQRYIVNDMLVVLTNALKDIKAVY